MTEDDARGAIEAQFGVDAVDALHAYEALLRTGSEHQNLVAPSTLAVTWARHLLDSSQLLRFAPTNWDHWVDVGSGAGLPGLVVAILSKRKVTLIEPRRLRVAFLHECIVALGLENVTVLQSKAETASVDTPANVISARAVASLDTLFAGSAHFTSKHTTFILPKGEGAKSEVAVARRSWHGAFHVEQSIVEPKSGIVIATGVTRR